MKLKFKFNTILSSEDSFSIEGEGLDPDMEEFLKEVRQILEKKDAVVKMWHEWKDYSVESKDEKTKPT